MDFVVKQKVEIQKQFNWKFWFKMICAILPLISIVVFLCAQSVEIFGDSKKYWDSTLGNDLSKYQDVEALYNMTRGQQGAYLFCRNILMITTVGNIFNAAWFINSAFNNKYEGQGKWDNQLFGTLSVNIIIFIVLFYNLSLTMSNDILDHMHWYNWMSWMLEHIFPDLLMIIYFLVFYPKRKVSVTKKEDSVAEWFAEMFISISFIIFMNIFFLVLGFSLRAGKGTRVFGEMSYTGYFPYPFYNFLKENKQVADVSWMKPWIEFLGVMILQMIEQVVSFACIHAQNKWQEKRLYGKLLQNKIN